MANNAKNSNYREKEDIVDKQVSATKAVFRKARSKCRNHLNHIYRNMYKIFFINVCKRFGVEVTRSNKKNHENCKLLVAKIDDLISKVHSAPDTGSISEDASNKINELQDNLDKSTKMVSGLKNKNADLQNKLQDSDNLVKKFENNSNKLIDKSSKINKENADLKQQLQNYQNQSDEDTANNVNSASDTSNSVDNSDNADISNSASASSDSNLENNFNNTGNINGSWVTRDETDNPNNQ